MEPKFFQGMGVKCTESVTLRILTDLSKVMEKKCDAPQKRGTHEL